MKLALILRPMAVGCTGVLLSTMAAAAMTFAAAQDMIGAERHHIAAATDTLYDIALNNGLGITELRAANPGVDPWLPPPGRDIVLPSAHLLPSGPRRGVIINLGDQRLYYFGAESDDIMSFPIGIGHAATTTPLGATTVAGKRKNPTWFPPESIRAENPSLPAAVPPGPANPLGKHALDLGWPLYVVHGTNRPYGIGRRVSHGCIRLRPEDIAQLFGAVEIGVPVRVVDEPIKVGWSNDELYLEAHPSQDQADEIDATGTFSFDGYGDVVARVAAAAADRATEIDWDLVRAIVEQRRGIPVRINRRPES